MDEEPQPKVKDFVRFVIDRFNMDAPIVGGPWVWTGLPHASTDDMWKTFLIDWNEKEN